MQGGEKKEGGGGGGGARFETLPSNVSFITAMATHKNPVEMMRGSSM